MGSRSLKGTQTEKNILTAFAGESQARNRYTYFASKAKKDGFVQISAIFTETADQEKEHAKPKILKRQSVEFPSVIEYKKAGNGRQNSQEKNSGLFLVDNPGDQGFVFAIFLL